MSWTFDENKPIFQQITDHIAGGIVSGKYKPGEKLPSVRELALEAGVNPNTMQRAMSTVEYMGLIVTNRTSGRIVTEDRVFLTRYRKSMLSQAASDYFAKAGELGFTREEAIAYLKEK
ncbi:MAG: GntR family transcriptional regulator [Saccharofermentans sp.]|nr:GntR family transcriptional regulator [Saccharofermentans sp.]